MKKIIAITIALCMAVALTACGVNIESIGIPAELSMMTGDTSKLEISYEANETDAAAIEKAISETTLTWASSDEAVVTVDAEGNVTAVAAGEADITVSAVVAKNEMSSTCHVTVTDPEPEEDDSVKLVTTGDAVEGTAVIEAAGVEVPETVSVEELTWESSDETVATVDEAGVITPVGPGTCTISVTGTDEDGEEWTAECGISVFASVEDIENYDETEVVVLNLPVAEEESGESTTTNNGNKNSTTNSSNKNSGTSASNGNSNKNSGTTSTGSGSTSGGNNNNTSTAPAPTPAPAPDPTPAPQPEVGPTCGTCGLPLWGGPVGNCQFGGNHPEYVAPPEGNIESGTTVEGGGSYDGNGADATPEDEVIPPEPQSVEESAPSEAQ